MGLATAKLLATRGAIISLADINEKALNAAIQSLANSEKHISSVVDVRSSKSVNEWIQSTVEKLGQLDGAVNMAGVITLAASVAEETDENWDFTFSVNTRGVFFCLRAQLNAMKPGGSIVSFAQTLRPTEEMLSIARTGLCRKCLWSNGRRRCLGLLCQ
jgi:NAD(P)-dependent dehydrogenase (short-subunit alcohol dehydrogenase family)